MPYLHHLLVHFPVAFSLAAAIGALLAMRAEERWGWLGRIAAIAAVAAAVLTAVTGLLSAGHVIEMGGDAGQIARHRNLALGATGLLAVSVLVMRFSKRRALGVTSAVIAAAAVGVAAHFGGDMLHPGLAPWSEAPHHHGPFSPTPQKEHSEHPATAGEKSAPVPAVAVPVASSAAADPSAPPKPAHDHSTHKH